MKLAIHGAVGSSRDWDFLNPHIPDITSLNLWSLLSKSSLSLSDLAKKINHDVDSVGDTLLGYSMGGRIALHCLLENPNLWQRAIIISAHTGIRSKAERKMRFQHDAKWAKACSSLPFDQFLQEWNKQGILSSAQAPSRKELEPWKPQIAQSFVDWSTGNQEDLSIRLAEIETKILWITGADDPKFTQVATEACSLLPSATHRIIPECGHRILWEKPNELIKLLEEFGFF